MNISSFFFFFKYSTICAHLLFGFLLMLKLASFHKNSSFVTEKQLLGQKLYFPAWFSLGLANRVGRATAFEPKVQKVGVPSLVSSCDS